MLDAEAKKIALLMDIAARAIDADMCANKREYEESALGAAYADWKQSHGITHHIERDTDEWEAMIAATSHEYDDLQEAKKQEKNAKRRLKASVEKYRKQFLISLVEGGSVGEAT